MMKKYFTLFLFCLLLTSHNSAHAFLPPSYFLVQKCAAERDRLSRALVKITVSRPAENNKTPEILLGESTLNYPDAEQSSSDKKSTWPALAMFLESNEEFMLNAWKNFGIPVKAEAELLRIKKEQYQGMKDMPNPFYKIDHTVSLKRFKNTYAFVCTDHNKEKSIWIEKDSFTPLAIQGPCPDNLSSLADLKGTEGNTCELQFEKNLFHKNPSTRLGKILLRKSNKTLLVFRITKVLVNPGDELWAATLHKEAEGDQQAHALLHYFF